MKHTIAASLVAALAILVAVPTASAGGPTQVQGFSGPDPAAGWNCGFMNGSLEGTLCFDPGSIVVWGGGPQVVITGIETFTGWVGGLHGTLTFAFRIESRFADLPPFYPLIPNGRCQHTVIDSGGDLEGTTGVIHMKDRWGENGSIVTSYSGHLTLPDTDVATANALARAYEGKPALSSSMRAMCGA